MPAVVVHVAKTLSTPGDFKEGVLSGVERVLSDAGAETEGAIALADVDYFVHGATVVLNALLERKLPKAALVTTRGFRDVLEIMRTNNSRMYDLKWVKPKPIIPRHLRFEVDERVRHTGEVLRPLDEAGTRETARRIKALDIRSVALCFLHAYANPDHERRAREILLEEHPAAHVTISSDVASELREFERTSTVAINASTIPIISAYLDGLAQALAERGLERELFVMQSNGGVITSRTARSLPVRTVMSGPAGGVVGAQFIANRMGLRNVATIDIGGTSSDMGVISEGLARTVDQSAVEGWPIMAPTIEILAIGAGGGSIAWVDAGGNAQKLLLARELRGEASVLIAHLPTRGLDVSACRTVHDLLLGAADAGTACVLISEDLEEVLALSTTIAVISRGTLVGEYAAGEVSRAEIGRLTLGHA